MTAPIPYDDSIASVTIEIRRRDGAAFAYDLNGDNVRITVQGDLPTSGEDDITPFGELPRYLRPNRVDFAISATRRLTGNGELLTVRQLDVEEQP